MYGIMANIYDSQFDSCQKCVDSNNSQAFFDSYNNEIYQDNRECLDPIQTTSNGCQIEIDRSYHFVTAVKNISVTIRTNYLL